MLSPGTTLQNRYRVVRLLGKGGMGAIYEAFDQRVSCVVALKETLVGANNEAREAFQREAALLANLRHAALPKVMDYFGEGSGEFLVMEYIAGDDLAELLEKQSGPTSVLQVLEWANQILKLLDYLHTREPPILHRDIKPANLKVTAQGEIFLLDFGLAKGAAGQMAPEAAGRSVYGYTPVYAPIEQIHSSGTDPRSDLYALGATLYDLLTGKPPIPAAVRFEALENNQPDPLLPISRLNSQVSTEESALVQWAMALSRRDRPASAAELRTVLRGLLEQRRREDDAKRAETTLTIEKPEQPADAGKPLYVDENVQFTVYAPRKIKPRKTYSLLAFAHLTARRPGADTDEPDPIEEVKAQAERLLGNQTANYDDVKQASTQPVPHGGELTFIPVVQGIEFSPPRRTFNWRKSVHREEFDMWVASEIADQTLSGRLTVLLGSLVIAEVALVITVDRNATSQAERVSVDQPMSARRVRQVYASYSRSDEPVVAELAQVAPLFGTRFVTDRTHLDPGEDRIQGLQRLIRGADMFQLFWSSNSMRSPETVEEIKYAASLGRPGFILPTYWEEPLPRSVSENLPPPEIERLQFHRIYPGAITHAAVAGKTKSKLVVMAPAGAEIFIDDERQGNVGSSGRLIINSVATGKHILRVSRSGYPDDERIVEVKEVGDEEVIQAQFRLPDTIAAPATDPGPNRDTAPVSFGPAEPDYAPTGELAPIEGAAIDTAPLEVREPTSSSGPTAPTDQDWATALSSAPQPSVVGAATPSVYLMVCGACGQQFSSAMKFCTSCGHTLQPLAAGASGGQLVMNPYEYTPPQPSLAPAAAAPGVRPKRKLWMPILAGAAMVLFVMIVGPIFLIMNQKGSQPSLSSAPTSSNSNARNRDTPANTNASRNVNTPANANFSTMRASEAGIEFVLIPPGSFMMGSDNGEADEKPAHQVTISYSFYLGKFEITQSQWRAVMGTNPSYFKHCDNCPVEEVSWDDAKTFIRKLNQMNDGYTYRLPTEAEWEYACLAGTSGGNTANIKDVGWYDQNSENKTHPVGQKQPNAFGMSDMNGNVWEWCEDLFQKTYHGAPVNGSAWLRDNQEGDRVLRGGSWFSPVAGMRSLNRFSQSSNVRSSSFGFRVAASPRAQ